MKGHPDKEKENLNTIEMINCKTDELAKAGNKRMDMVVGVDYILPGEKWQNYVGPTKVHIQLEESIREYVAEPTIKSLWNTKGKVLEQGLDEVNWAAISSNMKTSKISTRIWITKRMARDCGSNSVLFKRRQRKTDECPFCK
jgi:hypothetical protein